MSTVYYGGQAVFEGVMMRGRHEATVVVRLPDGSCVAHSELLPEALYGRSARLPFLRGIVMLWETMVLGTRMMLFSANVRAKNELGGEIPRTLVLWMMTISVVLGLGVFFLLPLLASRAVVPGGGSLWGNLVEGCIRLLLFLAYILAIGRLAHMKRVFEYHGAEHKTINAYEAGAPLTPASVQRFSTIHPRCGTAFLLWVVLISVLVFTALGRPPMLIGAASRIILVPVIAGLSYEVLRLGARFGHIPVVRVVLQPGLWLQRLTTRQPSDGQVEVAIAALRSVLVADGALPESAAPMSMEAAPATV